MTLPWAALPTDPAAAADAGLVLDVGDDLVTEARALFDETRTYRYALTRRWAPGPTVVFVMLNPSTADAFVLDPTVTRCMGFAKREGAGALTVVNLFALRATDPAVMLAHHDPVGAANDPLIAAACGGNTTVIAAWGAHGQHLGRGATVTAMLRQGLGITPLCLGRTKAGHPAHPLYLSATTPLHPYEVQ